MLRSLPEGNAAMGKSDKAADHAQDGCNVSFKRLENMFGPNFCALFTHLHSSE